MTDTPDGRPRPTPRPRPGAAPRPTPKPRVAGSRRDRDEADAGARPAPTPRTAPKATDGASSATERPKRSRPPRPAAEVAATGRRRGRALPLVLAVLCLIVAVAGGVLLWQRLKPAYVDSSVFSATRSAVQAVYAYDYKDSDGSVKAKLAVLTGDIHDEYQKTLSSGIIDTYEQVSATTRYEVLDVGLRQINPNQDAAKLVVFGSYVVKSVNSGNTPAPEGSGCQVTPEGDQACTQTVDVSVVKVDGDWKIDDLSVRTTS
jgi:hypothetical protein